MSFSPVAIETLLVTGATGFVGSHVVEAYQQGSPFRLRALVRQEADARRLQEQGIECVLGSLEKPETLREAVQGVSAVLHLAAATKARTAGEFQQANAAGTQAVVEAMVAAEPRPKRLIYLSSLAAVGPARGGRPVTRDTVPRPLTTYGRTKLAGEKVCEAMAAEIEVAILRAPAVYGPRDRDVFEFFRLASHGVMPLPSGAPRRLQMIHAADLARALLLAATAPRARGVYHVAEARSYLWPEMARMVADAVGTTARIIPVPGSLIATAAAISEIVVGLVGKSTIFNREKARELLAPGWLCETELARRDLGFEAHIPLDAGLQETAQWYKANGWL
ncbi:MAG TPA: NAD-dependent epimerase/dehydratase family protein [Longimicrobiales bacterium]